MLKFWRPLTDTPRQLNRAMREAAQVDPSDPIFDPDTLPLDFRLRQAPPKRSRLCSQSQSTQKREIFTPCLTM